MRVLASASLCALVSACQVDDGHDVQLDSVESAVIATMPAAATPVPADYNGDGATDLSFKASNGHWYLDIGVCNTASDRQAETGAQCTNNLDDDGDGLFNEGCAGPAPAETLCGDMADSDGDRVINDGCPHCQGEDRYGGRWDFAYSMYGDGSAIPVPADYGVVGGGVDPEHRVDLAIKDHDTGLWAIDYADNGFGAWDRMLFGYGFSNAVPAPADYDGDGRADLAIKTHQGEFLIDYAFDGFNGWNWPNAGCTSGCAQLPATFGDATWIPVPGDYNGDGRADLAVTGFVNGSRTWRIDLSNTANTGFTGFWDINLSGYGPTTTTAVPFNFDPWNGPTTDFGVKDSSGNLYIDVAVNGFGTWDAPCSTPTICGISPRPGYGGTIAKLTPGDFDGDGYVDLVGLDSRGRSRIDRGVNGWNGFEPWPETGASFIDNPIRPRWDATRPHIESTKIFGEGNIETMVLTVGVRYVVDVEIRPGSIAGYAAGVELNPNLGTPPWVKVAASTGSTYEAISGEAHHRFAITCMDAGNAPLGFHLRSGAPYYGGTEIYNPDYGIRIVCASPAETGISGKVTSRDRQLVRDTDDPDLRGIFVGVDPIPATVLVFTMGGSFIGADRTDDHGEWRVAASGGPYRVIVAADGDRSPVQAVNVMVPRGGIRVDTPIPPAFPMLPSGTVYRMYLDYSQGRTLMHTLSISPSGTSLRVGKADFYYRNQTGESVCNEAPGTATDDDEDVLVNDGCPSVDAPEWGYMCEGAGDEDEDGRVNDGCPTCFGPAFDFLWETGELQGVAAIMNGTWWNVCDGHAVNYVFAGGLQQDSTVRCDNRGNPTPGCAGANVYQTDDDMALYQGYESMDSPATMPMFTVTGLGTNQVFDIVASRSDYADVSSATSPWSYSGGQHIWDPDGNNASDIDHAIQIANPPLVRDCNLPDAASCKVIGSGDFRYDTHQNYDYTFARTSVGVAPGGTLFWVVADGENIHGGNGATAHQLAMFYKDVLGAKHAMGLDSGLSSEMLLRTSSGLYRVNTITGEDARLDVNPFTQLNDELDGNIGTIGFYMSIGP